MKLGDTNSNLEIIQASASVTLHATSYREGSVYTDDLTFALSHGEMLSLITTYLAMAPKDKAQAAFDFIQKAREHWYNEQ